MNPCPLCKKPSEHNFVWVSQQPLSVSECRCRRHYRIFTLVCLSVPEHGHGLLETLIGVIENLRKKITTGNNQLDAKLYKFSVFGRFQCWPCQIWNLKNLVLVKVASAIQIFGAVLSLALIPPPSHQTGSPRVEPVLREFKLRREEVGYTVNYDANYLLRPTLNLKKIQRIVIYRSSSSYNHNSHLSQILNDAHPRL